jgi:predicted TIM-barrel fold metal-dependent hydrolase
MHGYEPPPADPVHYAVPHGFRFVDAHVHLFDHVAPGLSWSAFRRGGFDHPRLKGAWRLDDDAFSVPQYRSETAGFAVDKLVHVQAADHDLPAGVESAWLQSLADRHGWPSAILAPAQLTADDIEARIATEAKHDRFRGVRDLSDPAAIGSDAWERGYRALLGAGGTCDLMITHEHFGSTLDVARRHPDDVIILEHCGLPVVSKLDAYQAAWREDLTRLATAPNVVIKLSALSSAAPANFFTATVSDWIRECIDIFGPERCMFASNFPIDRLFVTYAHLLYAFRRSVEDFTTAEQEAMFATTAERVYRI